MEKRYSFDVRTKAAVFLKSKGRCFYCGVELQNQDLLDDGGKVVSTIALWHVDHFLPLAKGGTNNIENLVPACRQCNLEKLDKTVEEFRSIKNTTLFYFEAKGLKP